MPLPKLHEQRALEAIEGSIRGQIEQKEREILALHQTLDAVQAAIEIVSEASRTYYGKHPL